MNTPFRKIRNGTFLGKISYRGSSQFVLRGGAPPTPTPTDPQEALAVHLSYNKLQWT